MGSRSVPICGPIVLQRREVDCQLHRYSKREVVDCLKSVFISQGNGGQEKHFHVAFVGESIQRHQYFSFNEVRFIQFEIELFYYRNRLLKICADDS